MIFGDDVESASTVSPAQWIAGSCRGRWGTVGALVPDRYPLLLRVDAPAPDIDDWWSAYRHLFEIIASTGTPHTSSPDRAWFAIWEGHGFNTGMTEAAGAAVGAALRQVPRFDLPHRSYHLLSGAVDAVTRLVRPGTSRQWCHPDLFWPDDRRWFVATDVDFWALYIGGDNDFIGELERRVPTSAEVVNHDHQLEPEN